VSSLAELSVEQPSGDSRQGKPSDSKYSVSGEDRRPALCWLHAEGCASHRTVHTSRTARPELWALLLSRARTWLTWILTSRPRSPRTWRTGSLVKVLWGKKSSTKWRTINSQPGSSSSRLSAATAPTSSGKPSRLPPPPHGCCLLHRGNFDDVTQLHGNFPFLIPSTYTSHVALKVTGSGSKTSRGFSTRVGFRFGDPTFLEIGSKRPHMGGAILLFMLL